MHPLSTSKEEAILRIKHLLSRLSRRHPLHNGSASYVNILGDRRYEEARHRNQHVRLLPLPWVGNISRGTTQNLCRTNFSGVNKTKAQLKIGKVTESIQPLQNSKNFAAFIIQCRYFRQCMDDRGYLTSHDEAEKDYKEASSSSRKLKPSSWT